MIYLIAVVVALVAVIVGANFGWRWVLAPLLGYALLTWLLGSLRAFTHKGHGVPDEPGDALASDERTLYWCEECGTELLLLSRGTSRAPSHCGQRMHERTERLS